MAGALIDGRPIVCVGFMGAGKTTAAQSIAESLGRRAVDVDQVIEERHGRPIARIFAEHGEPGFRQAEEEITLELLRGSQDSIISLGGGAVTSPRVREALESCLVVWMDIESALAWRRCSDGSRPLAQDRSQFERLYEEREPLYAGVADVIVPADRSAAMEPIIRAMAGTPRGTKLLWATSASGDYPAYIGSGLIDHGFWPETVPGRRFLVTDGLVSRHYGQALTPIEGRVSIMPGEQSKTIAHAEIVWTELVRAGMTRADVVVALGGGVVGDLAGFCAATYQRGVRYVQVPTTLVAQVDSAYGGKTGVDLPEAKNYVGAYHQPSAVIADRRTLDTLPREELAAGYAEVLKTALIAGGELWERVRSGEDPLSPGIVEACVLTKLRIVARDERDGGLRKVLNLGHTVAHAIEATTGYAVYRHGEAVALGLLAALRLSHQDELRDEVRALLADHALPTALNGVDPDAVVMATARDKKRVGEGPVPFVLLDRPGAARPDCEVPARDLIGAVRELAAA
jgi:shikimate kinase / 3-dehydroquinate synthase